MKVYHITEAGRTEPTVGGLGNRPVDRGPSVSGGGNTPRLTSVDIKDTGILDRNGNKIFKVVDQDGKELFRGNEAQSNDKRDTLRRNIRPAAAAPNADRVTATSPDVVDRPAAGGSKLRSVAKAGGKAASMVTKVVALPIVSVFLGAITIGPKIIEALEDYAEKIDAQDRGPTAQTDAAALQAAVDASRRRIALTLSDAIVEMLNGLIAGVGSFVFVTKFLRLAPGWGWVAALIVGGLGSIGTYVLTNVKDNEAIINELADWLLGLIDEALLENVTDLLPEDTNTSGTANAAAMKSSMKDLIRSDPKMIQAFKKAKELKAKATAS